VARVVPPLERTDQHRVDQLGQLVEVGHPSSPSAACRTGRPADRATAAQRRATVSLSALTVPIRSAYVPGPGRHMRTTSLSRSQQGETDTETEPGPMCTPITELI